MTPNLGAISRQEMQMMLYLFDSPSLLQRSITRRTPYVFTRPPPPLLSHHQLP